jgi:hypothetical protein
LEFLRSKFVVALIAALVWCGYAGCVFATCEDGGHEQEHAASHQQAPGEHCQCPCHQICTTEFTVPPRILAPANGVEISVQWPDFAPDGVPAAIDHPPQLA